VLTEEKLDEISDGLNGLLENPLDALKRRPGFKVSGFKFALFKRRNLNA
jgi:hypothetical protein